MRGRRNPVCPRRRCAIRTNSGPPSTAQFLPGAARFQNERPPSSSSPRVQPCAEHPEYCSARYANRRQGLPTARVEVNDPEQSVVRRHDRLQLGIGVAQLVYDVKVTVLGVKGTQVRVGIDAPENVAIHREEIYERIKTEREVGIVRDDGGL